MLWGEAYTGEGAANTQCKREKKGLLLYVGIVGSATTGLNTWCSDNKSMKFCAVLGAQGIRATGFSAHNATRTAQNLKVTLIE